MMKKIANYTIDGVIRTGSMGQLLKGYDSFGRRVAIKEILPEYAGNPEYRRHIDSELKAVQSLNDPNIAKVYQSFEQDGHLYIVMELVDGLTLEQYIEKNGAFSLREACNLMRKLLGTMQYVHNNDIIHRELKPDNVIIRSNGELCLLDFGISKDSMPDMSREERTQMTSGAGTDGYMSPEQANGFTIDKRSDIYSLGCLMFYMLTGRHAYTTYAGDSGRTTTEICTLPFPQVAGFCPGAPDSLQQVLNKATDKNMRHRYQSCREFSDDITAKCGSAVPSSSPAPAAPVAPAAPTPPKKIVITIGRENCDITTPVSLKNISRHHCDVELRRTPEGEVYRLIDHSKNGTLVDGVTLNESEYVDIRPGRAPVVYLSSEPPYPLDWKLVLRAIAAKGGKVAAPAPAPAPVKSAPVSARPAQAGQPAPAPPAPAYRPAPAAASPAYQSGPVNQGMSMQGQAQWTPRRSMSMIEAVKTCFNKYATFSGRASRSEYWYFYLFNVLVAILLYVLTIALLFSGTSASLFTWILAIFYGLATLLPNLAVTVRRFHDSGRSGVNLLWILLPVVGPILIFVFLLTGSTPGPNRYGPES